MTLDRRAVLAAAAAFAIACQTRTAAQPRTTSLHAMGAATRPYGGARAVANSGILQRTRYQCCAGILID